MSITDFGRHIRRLRECRNLTEARLAERSQLPTSVIRDVERGALSPSVDTLEKLCVGLDIGLLPLLEAYELDGRIRDDRDEPSNLIFEAIDHVITMRPGPGRRESWAARRLLSIIGDPYELGDDGPGGWSFVSMPEFQFGDDTIVPELAGWRRASAPAIGDGPHYKVPPDWICEVLSPTKGEFVRETKLPVYARWGVDHVWVVCPYTRRLEILHLRRGRWATLGWYGGDDGVRGAEPFDALAFTLDALWHVCPPGSRDRDRRDAETDSLAEEP